MVQFKNFINRLKFIFKKKNTKQKPNSLSSLISLAFRIAVDKSTNEQLSYIMYSSNWVASKR